MSTVPFPSTFPANLSQELSEHLTSARVARRAKVATHVIRRRPTMLQGRALESLGHAIEYLVDSSLYTADVASSKSGLNAREILMRASREVFADCQEILPTGRGLRQWLVKTFIPNHG